MSPPPQSRAARRYHQTCPVARSLDVIGERWTALIVRDLLVGPKRYKDLLLGLPGIGTNLLAARLHELEAQGLIKRRVLPPPAGSTVYELTEVGRGLEPVLMAIGRWGVRFLGPPRETDVLLASPFFMGMREMFRPRAAAGVSETYELRIGSQVFEVRVADGRCMTTEGRTRPPDVVFTLDIETLAALVQRTLSIPDALAGGRVEIIGDPHALERFVEMFFFGPPDEDDVRR